MTMLRPILFPIQCDGCKRIMNPPASPLTAPVYYTRTDNMDVLCSDCCHPATQTEGEKK